MKVADVMNRSVRTCRASDPLTLPARLMWEDDVGCVPVLDQDRRPIAVVTDRDIAMGALLTGKPLSWLTAADVMSRELFTARPNDSLKIAEALMAKVKVRRLPVIADDGVLVGIISLSDIARRAAVTPAARAGADLDSRNIARTLATIVEPREMPHA